MFSVNRKRALLAKSVRTVLEPLETRLLMHDGTHDGELPPVTLPFILDFDAEVVGIADKDVEEIGFHQAQLNKNATEYQPALLDLDVNAGLLNVTTSGTSSSGSNSGTDNTLVNGLETIFNATSGAFSITARINGPIDFIDQPHEQAGIMFGPDQDNFVKFIAYASDSGPVVEFKDEQTINGVITNTVTLRTSIGSFAAINTLDLRMIADSTDGSVRAYYSVNGAEFQAIATQIQLNASVRAAFFSATAHAGLLATHKGSSSPMTVSFDRFALETTASVVTRPAIIATRPADGETNVRRDAFVAADLFLPNAGLDEATLTSTTVKLYRTSDRVMVPFNVNTSGGGDTIVVQPVGLLDSNTQYTLEVTEGVEDTTGAAMVPYITKFTTGTEGGSTDTSLFFEHIQLTNTAGNSYTGVVVGPDGKLYAGTIDGRIIRYDINADGTLGASQTISALRTANGGPRLLTGIVFDPTSTADNLILWVTHGFFAFDGAPDWSGKITRMSGANLGVIEDAVVNLPRSIRDHLTNQLNFGPDGKLYFMQGSSTAMGAPDSAWGFRPEHLLTAAVLRLDTSAITPGTPLDVKTEEDGTYDPFAPGAPLTIYASGVRNAFDLLWHSNGKLYVPTNGSAAGGATPATPNPLQSGPRIDSALNGPYTGPVVPGLAKVNQTQNDYLFNVVEGGFYGHPNPTRTEYVLNGGNPTSGVDVNEVPSYPVGTLPDRNYRGSAYTFGRNYSPNGVIEYEGTAFGGALDGKMMVVRYSGGDDIIILSLDAGGNVTEAKTGVTGLTGFVDPVDLIENNATGYIYVAELGGQRLTLLRPVRTDIPPAAPTNFNAEPLSATRAQLTWSQAVGGISYRVYRKGPTDPDFVEIANNISATSYIDTDLTGATVYEYLVRAENPAGLSPDSNIDSITTFDAGVQYVSLDINNATPGTTTVLTEGRDYDVVAGGIDISGSSDSFRYLFQERTGDFDMQVQIEELTEIDITTKAGLMARASLEPGSPHVFASAAAGYNFRLAYRSTLNGGTTNVKGTAAPWPNVWVRLQRVGNTFTAYDSIDGVNWAVTGTRTQNMPATLYFGMAVAAKSATQTTTAKFRFLQDSTGERVVPNTINWVQAANAPIVRAESQGAVVDGKLYIFSGYTQRPHIPVSGRSDVYDPQTNSWTQLADMPVPTTHAGTVADGRNIYVAGGVVGDGLGNLISASSDVWRYNVDTNSWHPFIPLPQRRGAGNMVRLGRELHYIGGHDDDRGHSVGTHWYINLDDPNDTWHESAPLANPVNHLGAAVVELNNKIYVIGGQHGHNASAVAQADVVMWDPNNPTVWTPMAPLTAARSHFAAATLVRNGKIIIVAGDMDFVDVVPDVDEFDPIANTWRRLTALPISVHSGVSGIIGNMIIYNGGSVGGTETAKTFVGTFIDEEPPTAPANLTGATPTATRVDLTWDASLRADHYLVERKGPSDANFVQIGTATLNNYSDTTASFNTAYEYRVGAENHLGVSPYSNVFAITTPDLTAPAAPSNVVATAPSSSQVNLTWTDNADNEAGFVILRSTNGVDFTQVGQAGENATGFSDTTASPSTHYFYIVRAQNLAGASGDSNVAETDTPAPSAPTAPANLTGTPYSPSQIDLSWDASGGATLYRVERKGPSETEFHEIGTTANTTYRDGGLTASTSYQYRVRAENAIGLSNYSNVQSIATPVLQPFTSQDINATPPGNTVVIVPDRSWDVTAGGTDIWSTADSFRYVYEQRSGDFDMMVQIPSLLLVNSSTKAGLMARESLDPNSRHLFTGVTPLEGYRFSYRSSTGGSTANAFSGGTASFPNVWVRLRRVGDTFTAFYSNDGVSWTVMASRTQVMPETLYFGLAVSAKSSSSTTTAQFRNLVSAVPAAPANFDANATDATEINLTWDASTGATIYRIERKGPGESAFSEIGTTVGTSFLDNNLVPNSLYSYRIRAGNNVGLSEYSQVIDETTPSPTVPPTAPTNLLAQAVSQTKVQLSWTDTSALETSFDILRSTNGVDFTSVGQAAANATSFNDLTVQAGTLYYYQVKAVNGAGESPASNTSQTTTPEVDSYTSVDINATPPGETLIYVADTEYDVSAGGLDIWSTADGFRYVYRTLTGDFDMKMQVQSLTGVSPSIKAGLMVRESLDAGSRSIFAGVTQSDGYRLSYRSSTNGSTFNKYKGGTATFPNAWIRLRRAGNIFAGFVSTDGINWTSISTVTMALPDTLHFGMALTGKSSTALATAEFRNLGTYTPPPSGPPSATIVQVGTEPQPDPVSSVTIEFSQPITGFELNDLVLTRDGASVSLTGATLASNDNMTWTLGNLAPSTDRVGTYNLTLLAGSVANADGLLLPASASTSWMMNSLAGTGAADLVRLVRNGSVTDYYLNDQLQYSFDAAPLGTLLIDGSGGDDLLTLDLSSGDPVSSSITFDGGLGQDTVAIIGTAAASQVSFDTTSVSAGGTTLTHSAVERRTFDGGGSVLVNAGEVELLATQSLLGLTIGDGASAVVPAAGALRTLRTDNLSIAANGRLDLNDNDLVVTDGDFAAIQALVFQGFGGTTGITSSTSNGSQILALFDNALAGLTEWNGQTVAPNAIIGRYTFFGDANLDGQVTGDDYTVIDSNLDTDPPVGLEWLSGDMNLDGIVTGDDYTVIDSNLGLAELASRPLAPSSLFSVKPIEISSEEDEDPERMADMLT